LDWNEDGTIDEGDAWIEIYNPTKEALDLSGWVLEVADGDAPAYRLPKDTAIQADSYLVFYTKETGLDLTEGDLRLLRGTVVMDEVELEELKADRSLSRNDDGEWSDRWPPTPGEPNRPLPRRLGIRSR
ncbi:MAG: lamin tail domain-containing protein, partial [Anaerolineae bacterium]